jgi:hypothetical protein
MKCGRGIPPTAAGVMARIGEPQNSHSKATVLKIAAPTGRHGIAESRNDHLTDGVEGRQVAGTEIGRNSLMLLRDSGMGWEHGLRETRWLQHCVHGMKYWI